MTRRPPHSLDAEERALAAQLPRPHGRSEPGADLDARILAAAYAVALHPQPAARRPRRSWIGPTAVAASLVLAVGLAWQLRPPPSLPAPPATEDAASADAAAMSERAFETAPSTPPSMTQAKPMAAPPPPQAMASLPPMQDATAPISAPASVPAPPPAQPAPAVAGEDDAHGLPQAAEPVRVQSAPMAKATASEAMRERATASGTMASENREEAQRAADAATLGATAVAGLEEDVPPATADSPNVREAWLRRIGELMEQGKADEARASLDEFRRRYPDAVLPPELRKLEP